MLSLATMTPLLIASTVCWYLIGLILKIDQLEEEKNQLIRHDFLTGLLSRQAFFQDSKSYLQFVSRNPIPFSILAIDLDDFKTVNDTYGHAAGDAVLKQFSIMTNHIFRERDLVARIGGEEFAILLPNTTESVAHTLANRLHTNLRGATVKYNGHDIKYTVSIGLASTITINKIDALLEQADKALYLAKDQGKNCTVIFDFQHSVIE